MYWYRKQGNDVTIITVNESENPQTATVTFSGLTDSPDTVFQVNSENRTVVEHCSSLTDTFQANEAHIYTSVGTSGTGLQGQYYSGLTLSNLVQPRTDSTINFNWGGAQPVSSVGPDNFSVRWTGYVQAIESRTYDVSYDDG